MMLGKGSLLSAAFFVLAAAGLLSAWLWSDPLFSDPQVIACNRPPSPELGWIGLAFMALLFGAMINAVMAIFSGVFGQRIQDFVKGGLWGFVEGAALLCILAISMTGLQSYGEQNIDTARAYAVVIRNTVITDFAMVLGATTLVSFYTNINPQFKPFGMKLGLYLTFQVAPMFRPVFDTLGLMMQLLTTAILEWFAHDFMLCFVKDSMLSLLLPAGLFLRAFGLKGGGNALIGIALAFYFAYPFMLVQAGQIVTRHVQNEIVPIGMAPDHAWGSSCIDRPICCIGNANPPNLNDNRAYIENGDPSNVAGRLLVESLVKGPITVSLDGNAMPSVGTGATCIYNTILGRGYTGFTDAISGTDTWTVTKSIGAGAVTLAIMKLLNLSSFAVLFALPSVAFTQLAVYETVYFLFIVSIVLPIFNIFITLTLAKEITKALGTEIDLSSLEKLI